MNQIINMALLLDDAFPGWHNMVNLDILEMSDAEKCVLGQIHGNYRKDLEYLENNYYRKLNNNLLAFGDFTLEGTDCWKKEIQKRRQGT